MDRAILTSPIEILSAIEQAKMEAKVGFDIEADGLKPGAEIAGFSLYLPRRQKSVYCAIKHPMVDNTAQAPVFFESLRTVKAVTFNGAFDHGRSRYKYGASPKAVGDAQIAGKMLQINNWEGAKDLANTLGVSLDHPLIKIEEILGEGEFDFTKASLDEKTLAYTTQDAELAILLEEAVLAQHLNRAKYEAWDTVYQLEMDTMVALGTVECNGIPIDHEKFNKTVQVMERQAEELFDEICQDLGRDSLIFNLSSHKRLSAALFNDVQHVPKPLKKGQHADLEQPGLGLHPASPRTRTAAGYYSVSIDNLELIEDQHEVIRKIIEWKSLNSILTRDVAHVATWAQDGVIYPRHEQVGSDGTARIYAKQPNVISLSRVVREAMHPRPGHHLIHLDIKSAEFVIAALLSGEVEMLEAIKNGHDPHRFVYSLATGEDQVTPEQREIGKVLNYAAIFGSVGYSVGRSLKIDIRKARELLGVYWSRMPKMKAWTDFRREYAKKHARTYTVLGRVRRLPGVFSKNPEVKNAELRKAVNTACQGSCGDALKMAIVNIDRAIQADTLLKKHGVRILCPVFDALLLEVSDTALAEKNAVNEAIRREAEIELTYSGRKATLQVDIGWSATSWKDAMMDTKQKVQLTTGEVGTTSNPKEKLHGH